MITTQLPSVCSWPNCGAAVHATGGLGRGPPGPTLALVLSLAPCSSSAEWLIHYLVGSSTLSGTVGQPTEEWETFPLSDCPCQAAKPQSSVLVKSLPFVRRWRLLPAPQASAGWSGGGSGIPFISPPHSFEALVSLGSSLSITLGFLPRSSFWFCRKEPKGTGGGGEEASEEVQGRRPLPVPPGAAEETDHSERCHTPAGLRGWCTYMGARPGYGAEVSRAGRRAGRACRRPGAPAPRHSASEPA